MILPKAAPELLLPGRNAVRVAGLPHPFAARVERMEVPAGLSIAEIVERVLEPRTGRTLLRQRMVVHVGSERVPRAFWTRVRPKPGAEVTYAVALGDTPLLRNVLFFVVGIAALFVAPWLGGLAAGAIGISAGIGSALVGAAITIGGSLLINALFPIARTPQLESGGEQKQLLSIAGARNDIRPWGKIPVVLGRHRLSPLYAAKPYTEVVGEDQYLRSVFVWGYGPLVIGDFKIGDTPLSSYSDVETQSQPGSTLSESTLTLYPAVVTEEEVGVELEYGDGSQFHTVVSKAETDELSVDFIAPGGVFKLQRSTGFYIPHEVQVEISWRRTGSGDAWTYVQVVNATGGIDSFARIGRSKDPIRRGIRWTVPSRGQFDVRVRKYSDDNEDSDEYQYSEAIYWSVLRSFRNNYPVQFPKPLAATAIRIRATDQLNGALTSFNGVCESYVTLACDGSAWNAVTTPSRNPADLFVHVLRCNANGRPRSTDQIDLDNLKDWWLLCAAEGWTFDLVVSDAVGIYDLLRMIAAAGRALPVLRDGKWGVVFDSPDDAVVWHFTPANSSGFAARRAYLERDIPHALRVRFINATRGWADDERLVFRDGYDEGSATLYQTVEFPGVTDPGQVWRLGRYHLAQLLLRPEVYTLNADFEALRLTRGDRVYVSHDVPMWGLYAGRVRAASGNTVTVDQPVQMAVGKSYGMRFRIGSESGGSVTRRVVNTANETREIELEDIGGPGDLPGVGDLWSFGEFGRETVTLRVLSVEPDEQLGARLTLVDDAPEIYDADQGAIPAYDPGITTPPDPFTLTPSRLIIGETIGGSGLAAKAVVQASWQVVRVGAATSYELQQKDVDGSGTWRMAAVVPAPQTRAELNGLEPGRWAFRVRALFASGSTSNWAESGTLSLVGLMARPADVDGFAISVLGATATLSWLPVAARNLSHYTIKYGPATDGGVTWGTAAPLVARVAATSIQVPTRPGTYLIKAVTFQEVESLNAPSLILSISEAVPFNVVESITEDPDFAGTLDDVEADAGSLRLAMVGSPPVLADSGIYGFAGSIDLGAVYTSRLTSTIAAAGADVTDTMDTWASLATLAALSTADPSAWSVRLEYRVTDDDPAGSPVSWSEWLPFVVGDVSGRAFEFRAILTGSGTITPVVTQMSVTVDMPDRIIADRDVSVGTGGLRIDFDPPLKALRSLQVTVHGNSGDYAEISNKDEAGFDIVIKDVSASAVARTMDYQAIGYGRGT